jgi:hypothetical protein
MAKTVAETWGVEIADQLARWAIDAILEPPTAITTGMTRLPRYMVEDGRKILDAARFDWKAFKKAQHNDRAGMYARQLQRGRA